MIWADGVVQRQRLAAYAWCEDGDRVLLCRIAPGEADSGRWTLPGGGLEPHQTAGGRRLHLIDILYRITPTGGELRDETDNSTDRAAWIPFAELDTLPVVDLVRWARGQMGR